MSTPSGVVNAAFSTPIYECDWPESEALNAALVEAIDARRAASPEGISRALRGGWHSSTDLFEWAGDAGAELANRIYEGFQSLCRATIDHAGTLSGRLSMDAWANVTERGGYHRVHNHADSIWSGVYYVQVDDSDDAWPDSGTLEFLDPRSNANMVPTPGRPFSGNARFHPRPGLLIMFPSWLQHFVNPYQGDGRRISISFNLNLG